MSKARGAVAAYLGRLVFNSAMMKGHEFVARFDLRGTSTSSAKTIVPLKLDFVAQKKGAWPSRPCGDWSARSQHARRN